MHLLRIALLVRFHSHQSATPRGRLKESTEHHRPLLQELAQQPRLAKSWGIPLTSCPSSFAFRSSLDSSTINTYVAHCTLAPTLPSIATTAPSLPSISSISTSPSSNGRLSSHNYNLLSCSHIDNHPTQFSGLGLSEPGSVILTSRRRKSYLSKAIQRVGAKVASGRQFTLEGVLRALNTPGRVPP